MAMNERKNYLIRGIVGLLLLALGTNIAVVFWVDLGNEGRQMYDEVCISKGSEYFVSIDSGHIKCYNEGKFTLYKNDLENWKYGTGTVLSALFLMFNLVYLIGIFIVLIHYYDDKLWK